MMNYSKKYTKKGEKNNEFIRYRKINQKRRL